MKISIRAARQNSGLTQEQMAKALGVSRKTYQDYEHGDTAMRIDKAQLFSSLTKVPMDNIIFLLKSYG